MTALIHPKYSEHIGYSTADIPKTDNFEFITHVRGDPFLTSGGKTFSSPVGNCNSPVGCFFIQAKPKDGSKAKQAGTSNVWLVMNLSSANAIGYSP